MNTWTHAFGGVDENKNWSLVTFEESTVSPEDPVLASFEVPHGLSKEGCVLTYLTSWDHSPTEAEKDAITPAVYKGQVFASREVSLD